MASDTLSLPGKRRLWFIVLAEAVALAIAVPAMIYFKLGWIGAILIAAMVAVFTVMIVRTGEQRARSLGEAGPDRSGNIRGRRAVRHLAYGAIGERNLEHLGHGACH